MKSGIKLILVFACLLTQLNFALAQSAALLPPAVSQFLDGNGHPLSGGSVNTYFAGTSIPKTTWQDPNQVTVNTNPIILNSSGEAVIYGNGTYTEQVNDQYDNQIWSGLTTPPNTSSSTIVGDGDVVGTIKPFAGIVPPNQYVFAYGQTLSRITYATLFSAITINTNVNCTASSPILSGIGDTTQIPIGAPIENACLSGATVISKTSNTVTASSNSSTTQSAISTTFFPFGNGDGSTTFNLPDLRGYAVAGRDNMGNIAASRLTTTYFGANNPDAQGATGGNQSGTIAQANLPNVNFTNSGISISAIAMAASTSTAAAPGNTVTWGNGSGISGSGVSNNSIYGTTANTALEAAAISSSVTAQGSAASGGSGTAISLVQPTITLNYIIKITPDTILNTGTYVSTIGNYTSDNTLTITGTNYAGQYTGTVSIKCTVATISQIGCSKPDDISIGVHGSGTLYVINPLPITSQAITRSQIATSSNLPSTFSVIGYRTANDLGANCTYTVGSAAGLEAIESEDGIWYNLTFPNGTVNVGCFGAYGDGTAHLLESSDLTANPAWRGAYSTSWNWDAVALQEATFAALAGRSTPNDNEVGSAYLINTSGVNSGSGAGCTSGTQTFTVVGGTGTAATVSGTVINGVLSAQQAPLTIVTAGSYTAFPANPVTLSGGGCSTAPIANVLPANIVWNTSGSQYGYNKDLIISSMAGGTTSYDVNQTLTLVASRYHIAFQSGAIINWTGPTTAPLWWWDSGTYGSVADMRAETSNTPDWGTSSPLIELNWDGNYPGLKTQDLHFTGVTFIGGSTNFRGLRVAAAGSNAQGSTITFDNMECAAFDGDYCANSSGGNSFNIQFNNIDCQGFTHDCLQISAGSFIVFGGSMENSQSTVPIYPVESQFTTGGADIHAYSGFYPGRINSFTGIDSQSDIGVICTRGSYCRVAAYGLSDTSAQTWYASSYYQQGIVMGFQPGCNISGTTNRCPGSKNHSFMVVDVGGNLQWAAPTSVGSTTTVTDSAASYTTNQWVGYNLLVRKSNGYTYTAVVTANTATTITTAGLGTTVQTGDLYNLAGNTGASIPSFDSASQGYSQFDYSGSVGAGANTTAGSETVDTTSTSGISVNDYIVIPQVDCLGASPKMPSALMAKVTAVNSGVSFTLNKPACYTLTDAPFLGATPFTDGNLSLIDLDFDSYAGDGGSTLQLDHIFTPAGRLSGAETVHDFRDQRLDYFRTTEPNGANSAFANYENSPSNDINALGPTYALLATVTPASTIDLTPYLQISDNLVLTPAQNETLNFPTLSATAARTVTLRIVTSETSSYTLTCGSNVVCPSTLATGTTSGAAIVWTFAWNGVDWVEQGRSPVTPFGVGVPVSGGTVGNTFVHGTGNAVAEAGPATTLIGYADGINCNATGDTTITLTLPPGVIGWRITSGLWYQITGSSATTARVGIYSAASQGGTVLQSQTNPNAASTGINTPGAVSSTIFPAVGAVWNYTTIYLNVGTAQGATCTANWYLFGYPMY